MASHDRTSLMAFDLTEEQRMIRQAARSFAQDRLAPGAAERDKTGRFPLEFIGELAELGFLAMKVSIDDGGAGADNVGYVLAMEAISEACAATAVILASSNLSTKILSDHGTKEQKERWLTPYTEGKLGPASFALTEPSGGSDAAAIKTTAVEDGDHYVLDGSKMWITSGAEAGIHLVFAKTDPSLGSHGISCFVVERGTPGLSIGAEEDKMGLRSSGTVALYFDQCRVPKANMIGEPDMGYGVALSALAAGRIGIAAQSIGIAEAAFDAGVTYSRDRRAFGSRVLDFQNSQFVIADSRSELDAAWLLTLRAARLLDLGHRARTESSMAKVFASETCGRVVDRMLQLHGGYGYSREYPIERYYRDARVTRIYEGTNEIQRVIVAREVIRHYDV
jgi:alkylation response protein AidB-like acyl-CoA dehydrogenase